MALSIDLRRCGSSSMTAIVKSLMMLSWETLDNMLTILEKRVSMGSGITSCIVLRTREFLSSCRRG